ncbi:MAG: 3-isopropylmalate dehydratase small subunit [Betaproteobacteria bacterium]|nr:3-isopropylmalate dehydratase small subunit [Betaproteobacteria bacterium]
MITGRAWVFGDNINTDLIAPARLLRRPVAEFSRFCMEPVMPTFAAEVKPGDIVVGGLNFGCGSSREQAPEAIQYLGVAAVIAKSFARTFYRNSMNIGLPAIVCNEAGSIRQGARLRISLEKGVVENLDCGKSYPCQSVPPHLIAMLNDGGLLRHLEKRLRAGALRAKQQ